MAKPAIHGKTVTYSDSRALEALGKSLGDIKAQDRLTWADMGAVLGVSDDQASKYADGTATMKVVTYGRGKKEWGGRFTDCFDRLCIESRPSPADDNTIHSHVIRAALSIAEAKENGGQIFDWEIRMAKPVLLQARDAIDELLRRSAGS